jgi:hypothetical protein
MKKIKYVKDKLLFLYTNKIQKIKNLNFMLNFSI